MSTSQPVESLADGYVKWIRTHVGSQLIYLVYAAAVIFDEQGRILVQSRYDFDWLSVPGGAMELGESLAETARREVQEETGIEAQINGLAGLLSHPRYNLLYPNGDHVQQWTAVYWGTVSGGTLRPDGGETLNTFFIDPDEFMDKTHPSHREFVRYALAVRAGESAPLEAVETVPPLTPYYPILRQAVGHEPVILPGSLAVIEDEQGRLLATHRADFGCWDFPSGFADLEETTTANIVREVQEETGLIVEPYALIGLYSDPKWYTNRYPNGDVAQGVGPAFACRVVGGELVREGNDAENTAVPAGGGTAGAGLQRLRAPDHRGLPRPGRMALCPLRKDPPMPLSPYYRRLREQVGHDLLVVPGTAALVTDDAGRILLIKRGDSGQWSIPGGALEPAEVPAEGCAREVWEETGLIVEPERVVGVYGGPDMHITYPGGDEASAVVIVFACRVTGGTLHPDGDESLDVAFVDPADALARLPLSPRLRDNIAHLTRDGSGAFFAPAAWTPPADGFRENSISDYVRGLRERVGQSLLMVSGAAAIIFDEAGHVLLQKRGDTGRWGLIGGALDPDETPADAVVREVWEETGLRVEAVRIVGVYGGPEFVVRYPHGDEICVVSTVFECRVTGGELLPDGEESLALAYLDPDAVAGDNLIPLRMRERVRHAAARQEAVYFVPSVWTPPD